MKSFVFFLLLFLSPSFALFSQTATKQDIQRLIEQMREEHRIMREEHRIMREEHRIIREDMNKRFEQVDKRFELMREDMNKRFEQVDKRFELMTHIMYWMLGILSALILPLYFLLWKHHKTINIYQLEQQIYQSETDVKARIYLHLKKESEKYKTSIS